MTKLQEYRKKKQLSQFELAKKSGISIQSIQKYEQGVLKIESCHLENLLILSNILGVKFTNLFENSTLARKVEEQLGGQPVQHAER